MAGSWRLRLLWQPHFSVARLHSSPPLPNLVALFFHPLSLHAEKILTPPLPVP